MTMSSMTILIPWVQEEEQAALANVRLTTDPVRDLNAGEKAIWISIADLFKFPLSTGLS